MQHIAFFEYVFFHFVVVQICICWIVAIEKEIALAAFVKVDDDKTGFASFVNYGKRSVNAVFFSSPRRNFPKLSFASFPK